MVNPLFNKDVVIQIIKNIVDENKKIISEINDNIDLDIINKNDIKNDLFLKNKKIINKNYGKLLITISHSNEYTAFQFTLKYKNNLFQIIELLFWYNYSISDNINIFDLTKNKCILYQTDEFKILLPNLTTLIKSNIISMKSRIKISQFNKCTKDFYRIKYVNLIYEFVNNNMLNIEDILINKIILDTKKIYKKNLNIFKFPYTICSLSNSDKDKNLLYDIYDEFLNLQLEEQIKILLNNKNINENKIIKINNLNFI
jgi:hypothetical protein